MTAPLFFVSVDQLTGATAGSVLILDGPEGRHGATVRRIGVGEHVLLTPSNGGLGVVAWGVPIVALVLGAAGIVLALRRWSITPRLSATADDEDVVDRERHRPEQDEPA